MPFSVKKNVMGFPIVPRATRPSPVFFLPQWSAHFRMVTGASLLVIPRGGIHHPRSPRMAQTPPIPADDLDTRVRLQPLCDRGGRAHREQINHLMALEITHRGFLHIPSKRYIPTGQSGFVFGPNGVITVECIGSMAKTLVAWQVYRKVYLLIPSDFHVSFHVP